MKDRKNQTIKYVMLIVLAFFVFTGLVSTAMAEEEVVLRVAFPQREGFTVTDEDGHRSGLVVDWLNEIAKYTGWKYEYVDVSEDDLYTAFARGEFDLMGGVFYVRGMEDQFGYPEYSTGLSRSLLLTTWADINIYESNAYLLEGKTIGVNTRLTESVQRLEDYLNLQGVTCTIKPYGRTDLGTEGLYPYLESGEVDLIMASEEEDDGTYRTALVFEAQPHYIVTNPKNKVLLSQLNDAMERILDANPHFADTLYSKNFPERGLSSIVLTEDERKYIDAKKTVSVAVMTGSHPFYCDDEPDRPGIIPEVLDRISEFSGLTFEYIECNSYADMLQMVQSGEAEMMGSYLGDEEMAGRQDMVLTRSYSTFNNLILRNKSVDYPTDNLRGAFLSGREAPENIEVAEAHYYQTVTDLIAAVNRGDADVGYGLSVRMESVLQNNVYPNVAAVSIYKDDTDVTFAFAKPANPVLLGIINKGINRIPASEKDAIAAGNMFSTTTPSLSLRKIVYANPLLIVGVVCVIFVAILLFVFSVVRARIHHEKVQLELEKKEIQNQAKSQFLSQMSHEIRTPINGVLGMTELSRKCMDDPEELARCLDKIDISSKHLLALVNDVLDMSKIESGKIKMEEAVFNFGDLLKSIRAIFYAQAKGKDIEFTVCVSGDLEDELVGDALRLRQILTNLLSNAMKFTEPGGEVSLHVTEYGRDEKIEQIRFEVRDTGIGIAKGNFERIFEPFEQESGGTVRRYGGTGLGLPITKSFVEMMGGTISVDSQVDEGSCFTVEIPFSYVDPSWRRKWGTGQRALVVDGVAGTQQYLCGVLEREGYRVDYIASEAQMEELEQQPKKRREYALCFMGAQSLEVLREKMKHIKTVSEHHRPIIVLTGSDEDFLYEISKGFCVDHVLCGPIFRDDIAKLNQSLLFDAQEEERRREQESFFRGRRILVVEDNSINREIASKLLLAAGALVDCATNGKEAVEIFDASPENHYELILMDIQMPIMDGNTATGKIRGLPRKDAKSVIIFALSANMMQEDAQDSVRNGMNAYLTKPFSLKDIRTQLKKCQLKEGNL